MRATRTLQFIRGENAMATQARRRLVNCCICVGQTRCLVVYTITATKLLAPDYVVDLGITLIKNLTFH